MNVSDKIHPDLNLRDWVDVARNPKQEYIKNIIQWRIHYSPDGGEGEDSVNLIFRPIFLDNYLKMKKIESGGGEGVRRRWRRPWRSLGSTTAILTYSEFEVVPGMLVDLFKLPLQREGEFRHGDHVMHVLWDAVTQLESGRRHVRRWYRLYLLYAPELWLFQDLWRQQ